MPTSIPEPLATAPAPAGRTKLRATCATSRVPMRTRSFRTTGILARHARRGKAREGARGLREHCAGGGISFGMAPSVASVRNTEDTEETRRCTEESLEGGLPPCASVLRRVLRGSRQRHERAPRCLLDRPEHPDAVVHVAGEEAGALELDAPDIGAAAVERAADLASH